MVNIILFKQILQKKSAFQNLSLQELYKNPERGMLNIYVFKVIYIVLIVMSASKPILSKKPGADNVVGGKGCAVFSKKRNRKTERKAGEKDEK